MSMKCLSSFQELDALGEGLAREYTKKTHRWNSLCFDIEGFIRDYLGLEIVYETFAEHDSSKIGFLSDGKTPLLICKDGKKTPVIFPKNTIVIERFLLRSSESSRRRFTLAHEVAHLLLEKHIPMQASVAYFHSEYDTEYSYSNDEIHKMFSLNESFANRLGAAIIMPTFLIDKELKKHNSGQPLLCYDGGVFAQEEKLKAQKMADNLGVSYSAFINRLRELNLLDWHPIEEYFTRLHIGGV